MATVFALSVVLGVATALVLGFGWLAFETFVINGPEARTFYFERGLQAASLPAPDPDQAAIEWAVTHDNDCLHFYYRIVFSEDRHFRDYEERFAAKAKSSSEQTALFVELQAESYTESEAQAHGLPWIAGITDILQREDTEIRTMEDSEASYVLVVQPPQNTVIAIVSSGSCF